MATTPVKRHFSYTVRDFYGFYRTHKKQREEEPLEYKKYKGIIRDAWVHIIQDVVKGGCFIMPHKLGMITVKKVNRKFVVDKITSQKVGKYVPYLARHTHGHIFRYNWIKSSPFKNRQFYKFKFVSTRRTQLKHQIGQLGLKEYIFAVSRDPMQQSYTRK